jgi:Cellulase (glycosyl hydrolase family 5)
MNKKVNLSLYICMLGMLLGFLVSCQQARTAAPPTSTPVITATSPSIPQLPPVKIDHLGFVVEGKPFRFIGANSIYFGFYKQYGFSMDEAIRSAKDNGINVLRIYLGFGTGTWSGRPMEEYDKALDIAARNGMYVVAVLTDCCCRGGDWSQTDESYYQHVPYCNLTNSPGLVSMKDYIKSVLLRKNTVNGKLYRDDTTILAWDVANEPFLHNFSASDLNNWLSQVTLYIKSVDPAHLVTFGLDASGSVYDTDGSHYDALNVPALDFFSFHYNQPNFFIISQKLDLIQFRVEKLLSMGKPVVLEEFGVGSQRVLGPALDQNTLDKWTEAYKNQMDVAFSAGASGAMFWGWGVPGTRTVPLWWKDEDHDVTETEFCTLIREYQIPPPGSFHLSDLSAAPPNDDFEGTLINLSKWQTSINGSGSITQNGRMILSVDNTPANSNAAVASTWALSGDFDIQIDFEIGPGWGTPSADHLDGAAFGVNIGGQTYHITRLRSSAEDKFFAWSNAVTLDGSKSTTAVSGKYRLVRTGTDLALFYDIGNGWQELVNVAVLASNAQVYFTNGSVNASQAFTTYFDNFHINSGLSTYRP